MHRGDVVSPLYITSYNNGPYNSSIASSASSSSSSVWSDASSQISDDTSVTSLSSDTTSSEHYDAVRHAASKPTEAATAAWAKTHQQLKIINPEQLHSVVAPELRKHPRRTSTSVVSRSGPPSLVRQCERRGNFVDNLVDSSAQIVEAIWPLSSVPCRSEIGSKGVLPLRTFIQETLRRSRTSFSTLQVALYYLILIKSHVPKHDFTMEQPEDTPCVRSLQCGRRMFLAALILASKYLQDRNYSARAWSKISGLQTHEINQNEMAFLLAVNWKLHITDAVFQRWTDIVLRHTPQQQPPSPGGTGISTNEWKRLILQLEPGLENVEGLMPLTPPPSIVSLPCSTPTKFDDASNFSSAMSDTPSPPRSYTPQILEPPATVFAPAKAAPALGLLPTPRLTPQASGLSTPAVSVTPCLGRASMGLAMAQIQSTTQSAERWPGQLNSTSYVYPRRSSLATSTSSMSSPESMISDTSSRRSSRSSSFSSSASSMMSAPLASKLDVQARCRYAKQCSEKNARTTILSVPEDDAECVTTSSPESYTGPVGKDLLDLSLETPAVSQDNEADFYSRDSVNDAARALQDLHNYPRQSVRGAKRSRPQSTDLSLQENVREMLSGRYNPYQGTSFSDALARVNAEADVSQVAIQTTSNADLARKRVCCAAEANYPLQYHPSLAAYTGVNGRPGMWQGILN